MFRKLLPLVFASLAFSAYAQDSGVFARSGSSRASNQGVNPLQTELARQSAQIQNIQLSIQGIQAQLDAISRTQENLSDRMAKIEQNAGKADSQEIIALRRDIDTLRRSQATLRTEIVNDLTAKITKLAPQTPPVKPRPTPADQTGYDHKVARGQTLSLIAKEYGTTVQAIMKANNLKDAGNIREGQTLFIPD